MAGLPLTGSAEAAPRSLGTGAAVSCPISPGGLLPALVEQGLAQSAFWLAVPFAVRSKSNFRRYTSTPPRSWKEFRDFEQALSILFSSHLPKDWETGSADKPLPSRPAVVAFILASTPLDAANLSKGVLDAAQGTVVHNDASVRYCASLGIRSSKHLWGLVAFAQLEPKATPRQLLEAATALQYAALTQCATAELP